MKYDTRLFNKNIASLTQKWLAIMDQKEEWFQALMLWYGELWSTVIHLDTLSTSSLRLHKKHRQFGGYWTFSINKLVNFCCNSCWSTRLTHTGTVVPSLFSHVVSVRPSPLFKIKQNKTNLTAGPAVGWPMGSLTTPVLPKWKIGVRFSKIDYQNNSF